MKLCPQCETGYADSHVTCPTHGVMLGEIRDLRPGMLIRNTYRIVRKLGQGGMGAVYLAEHTLMGERQALKFLSPDLSKDEAFTSRFLREVRTLRQVRHRNVVDAGNLEPAEDGTLFFSMEFVDGPDLRDFLNASSGPLEVELALAIARSVAEGLGAAHALGMVHRDIKPENILLARSGDGYIPKIADFGIVATKENSSLYTRTGGTLLTMAYAAPEQWRGVRAADLDGRTDLYALGGVLYEMLTGRNAFAAEGYEGWAEQHKNVLVPPPSTLRQELASWAGLDSLVLRLLAKDREKRPKDAAEVIRLLEAIRCVAPKLRRVTEREDAKAAKRVSAWVWVAFGVFLLLAAFFVGRAFGPRASELQQGGSLGPSTTVKDSTGKPGLDQSASPQPKTYKGADMATPPRPGGSEGARQAEGTLVVTCDLACRWTLDGQVMGNISPGSPARATIEVGQHSVNAVTVDGADQVGKVVDVKAGGQSVATLELNPVREQRFVAEKAKAIRDEESRLTWTDPSTGLMWAKQDNGEDLSWGRALDYCQNLNLAGHADFRLPTVDELQAIYSAETNSHTKGGIQTSGWEWSGSSSDTSRKYWTFIFRNGTRFAYRVDNSAGVRVLCVRHPN